MKNQDVLAGGLAAGMFAGGLWGISGGWGVVALGMTTGPLLGAGVCGVLLAARRWPLATIATLVLASPLLTLIGALTGFSALPLLAPLLALAATGYIAWTTGQWRRVPATPLTVALGVYLLLNMLSALLRHPGQFVQSFMPLAAPGVLYLAAIMAQAPRERAAATDSEAESERRGRIVLFLGWAACGVALVLGGTLALLSLLRGVPVSGADRLTLAQTLAMLLILALAWDSRRTLLRLLLGPLTAFARGLLVGGWLLLILSLAIALLLTLSWGVALGVIAALVTVYVARRQRSGLLWLGLGALLIMRLASHRFAQLPLSGMSTSGSVLDAAAWQDALNAASMAPFGSGRAALTPAGSLYLQALGSAGIPGLIALLVLVVFALEALWRGYQRLRPMGGEAGGILAALGMTVYIAVSGLATDPLRQPAPALVFWLFLGLSSGTLHALPLEEPAPDDDPQLVRPAFSAARGHPLRVAYVSPGSDFGETPAVLADYFQSLDRQRVTPLLITWGEGPLVSAAQGMRVSVRVIRRGATGSVHLPLWMQYIPGLVWLSATPIGEFCGAAGDDLLRLRAALGEVGSLLRVVLDLRPDVLVSASPWLHLPVLIAGRACGVPVLWHARDHAPYGQGVFNLLAFWTAGVLVPSQTLALDYQPRWLRSRVRVLRPSVVVPDPLSADEIAHMRHVLGAVPGEPLLAVVAPVIPGSGMLDLLEAVARVCAHHPGTRVIITGQALPGQVTGDEQGGLPVLASSPYVAQLADAIATRGLESCVRYLGDRLDMPQIVSAADMVIFPQRTAPSSRGLLVALALGKPVVATAVGALTEQLADAWGFELALPGDPDGLARAILRIYDSLDVYQVDAQRSARLIRDWFATPVEMGRLHLLYRTICLPAPLRVSWHKKQVAARTPKRWLAAFWVQGK